MHRNVVSEFGNGGIVKSGRIVALQDNNGSNLSVVGGAVCFLIGRQFEETDSFQSHVFFNDADGFFNFIGNFRSDFGCFGIENHVDDFFAECLKFFVSGHEVSFACQFANRGFPVTNGNKQTAFRSGATFPFCGGSQTFFAKNFLSFFEIAFGID